MIYHFFLLAFRIWNEHIRLSSTLIIAPLFSNYPQQFGALKIVTSCFFAKNSQPSSTTWCALQIRSMSFEAKNLETIYAPKTKLTPLQFGYQSVASFQGSDHRRSQRIPMSGTSTGRTMLWICSREVSSGLSPPCMQMIFQSITAQTGKTLKRSLKVFHSFMEYLLLHQSQKPQVLLMEEHSWLPRSKKKFQGQRILKAISRQIVSIELRPLSTQSPRKRQFESGGNPPNQNIRIRSRYCPWTSPQILMGAQSSRRMGWLSMIYLALRQRVLISDSRRLISLKEDLLSLASSSLRMISSRSIVASITKFPILIISQ